MGDEYICGLEKRSHVFVRNELQASLRIRASQTAPRLIAEFSLSAFRMPDILTVNTMRKSYSGAEEFNFSSPLWVILSGTLSITTRDPNDELRREDAIR
jgi:hypothetical protein